MAQTKQESEIDRVIATVYVSPISRSLLVVIMDLYVSVCDLIIAH